MSGFSSCTPDEKVPISMASSEAHKPSFTWSRWLIGKPLETKSLPHQVVTAAAPTVLTSLELKGGDANDDQNVNLGDASAIGSNYGATGDINADVNFSGRVDVFDLAMVGGNFTLNAANAYAGWAP